MKSFTFLPRVILGLVLFVTGGGISLAADTYVTNTAVNGTTYTFKVTSTKDKTANVSLSQIGGTALASYNGTYIDLIAAYPNGTFTVDGTTYTITSMDAMNRNTTIKTVEMPSTVTSLPNSCFDGCSALTTVSFPGLKTIGNYAFQNCSALTGISIPEGATVGESAFQNCTGLKGELTIPKGTYDNRTFDGCTNVTELVIYTGSKISNPWNNYGCFGNMSGVTKVTLKDDDDGDHTIPAHFFGHASFSTAGVDLTIPESITAIGDGAFYSANFPKNLKLSQFTSIGSHAFEGNTTLANNGVTFAKNTTIGEAAFSGCTSLEGELTIPKGTYNNRVFDGCKKVTELVIYTGSKISYPWNNYGCFGNMQGVTKVTLKDDDDGDHTIPAHFFGHASFSTAGVDLTIPESITAIGDGAFYSANFPTKLDLSNQFTSYGASAFEDNTAFKGNNGDGIIAVQKPKSATSDVKVDSKAFSNTGATEIDIYPNVDYSACKPSDNNYSFGNGPYNGENIKTIKFTDKITSVPDYVFLNASDIPSTCTVTWPTKPITHIGNGAFYGVQFTAAIPSKMSGDGTIGEYAYAHNNMSGEITIPTGCKDIGSHALYDCDNITKITVDSTTTSIGEFAFSGCAALDSVKLPTLKIGDPQLTLGGGFIANDPKLTAFTITNAVKTIYCCSNGNTNNASFSSLTTPFTVTLASDKVKAESKDREGGTFFTFDQDGTANNPNTLTIKVANGVTSIPDELFSENESGNLRQSFIDKIVLSGKDVKSIGTKSFYHIRALLSVDMSGAQNIANIGESAFADCAKLTTVTFGESSNITTVGASAFSGCSALTSVDFGGAKKLQTLGESAFNNCSSLAKINQASDGKNDLRSSTLTRIGRYTFGGCTTLANLYLPSTLMRINAEAFTNGSASVAKAASDDKVFIKADIPFGITTFSRGFGVKYNSTDNADKLAINDTIYNVWIPTSIDTKTGTLVLQQYTGTQVLSDEVDASVQQDGTKMEYTSQPVGFLLIQEGWQQKTPTKLTGDAAKAGTGSVNMRVLISSGNVQKSWSNDDFSGKTLMRGVIDPVNIKDVTDKYGISKRDLALHAMTTKGTFPAGRAYIYARANSGSGSAKYSGFTLFYSDEPLTNTTTGINKGVTEVNKDRMADDSYYDLSGRKVNSPTEGVYIHHGRKVVIKRM